MAEWDPYRKPKGKIVKLVLRETRTWPSGQKITPVEIWTKPLGGEMDFCLNHILEGVDQRQAVRDIVDGLVDAGATVDNKWFEEGMAGLEWEPRSHEFFEQVATEEQV